MLRRTDDLVILVPLAGHQQQVPRLQQRHGEVERLPPVADHPVAAPGFGLCRREFPGLTSYNFV